MHTVGTYEGNTRTLEGVNLITFSVPDEVVTEYVTKLEGQKVTLDFRKFFEGRSLSANAYLWVLCEKIAQKLLTDKDTIYLMQLKKYGVFQDITIKQEALKDIQRIWKYTEVFSDGYDTSEDEYITVRCYMGSSKYDTKEMSRLLEGTICDCKDIGVQTYNQEEVDRLLEMWEGSKNGAGI